MGLNKRDKNSDFLVQGSILAVAAILSRIIGMVYRIPLTNIIGDEGMGYYSVAFEIYNIALLLSSYSLPLAVSKLVAARAGRGEERNAFHVFKAAFLFAAAVGTAVSIIIFLGADFITERIMNQSSSAYALKVLAPALLIVAVMGVIRGYFQGIGTMVPTAISQIIEQIVNAIVSVAAAAYLYRVGEQISKVTGNITTASAYGAAGGTAGTSMGAVVGIIFLAFVILSYKKVLKKRIRKDQTSRRESSLSVYKVLIITIIPVVLSTAVYNISGSIDQGIFNSIMKGQGYSRQEYATLYGIFSGKYKLLVNVPVAIASAMASSIIPGLTIAVRNKEHSEAAQKINMAIRFTMVITIPCAVGLTVLASPILRLLWNDTGALAANLLRVGSIAVVFYSLSTLTNGILQGLNRMRIPVRNAVIALVIHLAFLYVMLAVFKWGIYAVVYANIIFSFTMCVLNAIGIRGAAVYEQEVKRTFVIPAAASAVMGAVIFMLHMVLEKAVGNKIATVAAIGIGAVIYFLSLLLLKEFDREELMGIPKGHIIVRIAEKLRLM